MRKSVRSCFDQVFTQWQYFDGSVDNLDGAKPYFIRIQVHLAIVLRPGAAPVFQMMDDRNWCLQFYMFFNVNLMHRDYGIFTGVKSFRSRKATDQ